MKNEKLPLTDDDDGALRFLLLSNKSTYITRQRQQYCSSNTYSYSLTFHSTTKNLPKPVEGLH